jgi:hypothetical protein
VPFIFLTGYDPAAIPDAFADAPRLLKPVETRAMVRSVARRCGR